MAVRTKKKRGCGEQDGNGHLVVFSTAKQQGTAPLPTWPSVIIHLWPTLETLLPCGSQCVNAKVKCSVTIVRHPHAKYFSKGYFATSG